MLGIPTLITFLKRIRESINESKLGKERVVGGDGRDQLLEYRNIGSVMPQQYGDTSTVNLPAAAAAVAGSASAAAAAVQRTPLGGGGVAKTVARRNSGSDMMYLLSSPPHNPPTFPSAAAIFSPHRHQPPPSILPATAAAAAVSGQPTGGGGHKTGLRPVFHAEAEFPLLDLSLVKPLTASCINSPVTSSPADNPSPPARSRSPSPVAGPSGLQGALINLSRSSVGGSKGVKDSLLYQVRMLTPLKEILFCKCLIIFLDSSQ